MSANQIVLYKNGEPTVAADPATDLAGIPQAAVSNLVTDLGTLTSSVATANTNASAAVATADAAAADAAAAVADAAQAQTDAAAAAVSASDAANSAATSAASASAAYGSAASAASDASAAAASALAAQGDAANAAASASASAVSAASAASDASAASGYASASAASASASAADALTAQNAATASAASADSAAVSANDAASSASSAATDALNAASSASAAAADALTAQNAATASAASAAAAATDASNAATSASAAAADAASAISTATAASAAAAAAQSTATSAASSAAAAVSTADAANATALAAQTTANNALPAAGGTISGNLAVQGNLNVQGDVVYNDETRTLVRDPFVDFGIGNFSGAKAGGFTVNVVGSATLQEVDEFVAGVDSGSTANPYFLTDSAPAYVDGDIIQIVGSKNNDGLYVFKASSIVSPGVVKVEIYGSSGMPDTRPSYVPFAQNNFVAETVSPSGSVSSSLASVASTAASDGSAFNGIAAGQFCLAYGAKLSDFDGLWVEISPLSVESIGETVLAGDLLAFDGSGNLVKASNTSIDGKYDVRRVALVGGASAASIKVVDGRGAKPVVNFVGSTPAKGEKVYLSDTAGKATTTAPTASGKAVIVIGRVASAISASQARVDFAPFVQILL